jgi:hypothetical protein
MKKLWTILLIASMGATGSAQVAPKDKRDGVETNITSLEAINAVQKQVASTGDVTDGVSMSIDLNLVKDLLDIAQHSKLELEEGVRKLTKTKYSERRAHLRKVIDNVIDGSDDKGQELYMRSVLRRARILDDIIAGPRERPNPITPELYTVSYRLLRLSVLWAIELYVPEKKIIDLVKSNPGKAMVPTNFFKLGVLHSQLMLSLFDLAPQHDTKVELARTSLKLLANDINRDLVARQVASHVVVSMFKYLNEIEGKRPGNTLEGLALYREINEFTRDRLKEVSLLVSDLGMEPIPGVPTLSRTETVSGRAQKGVAVMMVRDITQGRDPNKSSVYIGDDPNSDGRYEDVEWLRENNLAVPPTKVIQPRTNEDKIATEIGCFEPPAGAKICKGDAIVAEYGGKRITGIANHVFNNSMIEIRVHSINREVYDGYAVWSTDWIKKAQ